MNVNIDGVDIELTLPSESDPMELPPWYNQFIKLDDKKKKEIISKCLAGISKKKPEAFKFIKKFNCKLVGLIPHVSYALPDSSEGNETITWVHGFALPTLLFWCDLGEFGLFINPNLDHDNTVLNKVTGNKKHSLRGFTS